MKRSSRRGWLSSLIPTLEPPRTPPRAPANIPMMRPPGALPESQFLAACTRCSDCITACPHDVLIPASLRWRHVSGTPTFKPMTNPCRLCEGLPCAAACPTDALKLDRAAQMGTAQINPMNCTSRADGCQRCVDHCPVPWAIQIRPQRAASIDAKACVGCGLCAQACPAPVNAVLVMPRREKPAGVANPLAR